LAQAGFPKDMPAEAPTMAAALQPMGYAGQFGKNHRGELNSGPHCTTRWIATGGVNG
jgi:arylsulfatase A-like enzyme